MAKLKPGTICPTCLRKVPHRIVFRRVKPRRGPMREPKYRNGMSSKGPDSSCVPLCRKHHDEFDQDRSAKGRAAFDAKYGVVMRELAKQHYARYLEESGHADAIPAVDATR